MKGIRFTKLGRFVSVLLAKELRKYLSFNYKYDICLHTEIGEWLRTNDEMENVRTYKWMGKIYQEECINHSFRWTGQIPCTGKLICLLCGAEYKK